MFSFVAPHLSGRFPAAAIFEWTTPSNAAGGEGSAYAIDDIIRTIRVPWARSPSWASSENKVAVNTRDVLEKGLTLVGCSRSGRADFDLAVELLEEETFQKRMEVIVTQSEPVRTIADISRVMAEDLTTPFKTVFRWNV